jgi:hypothetical protein
MAPRLKFPVLTPYEEGVFRRFWTRYEPPYHFRSIQLEGNKRLPVVAAGYRLVKKGLVTHWESCKWGLTDLGVAMALDRQRKHKLKP